MNQSNNTRSNPFFVHINNRHLDTISKKDLFSRYKHVLIICTRSNIIGADCDFTMMKKILDYTISNQDYIELGKYYTLIRVPSNIIKNNVHYNESTIIAMDDLQHMNHNNLQLEQNEIVVPMYELDEESTKLYAELYSSNNTILQLESIINLSANYCSYKKLIIPQLNRLVSGIKELDYWTKDYNCNFNMDKGFKSRKFAKKNMNIDINIILDENIDTESELGNKVIDKLDDYNTELKTHDYVDIAGTLYDSNKRTYFSTQSKNIKLNKESLTDMILTITNEQELFIIFNSLLISKDYCHLVLNNRNVLEYVTPLLEKYKLLYKYLFGYAWLSFYTEECIFKTKSTKNSRFVFDINTATKLPFFPFCVKDIHQNPYISLPVSKTALNCENNSIGFHMIHDNNYGLCDLMTFKKRLNIFACGDHDKDIFEGINWDTFAISGSIIPAALQKDPPLLKLFSKIGNTELDNFNEMYTNLYGDSDIDLMCNKTKIYDFLDEARLAIDVINKNSNSIVDIDTHKTIGIVIHKLYFEHILEDIKLCLNNNDLTVNVLTNMLDHQEVREYFYQLYIQAKIKKNREDRKNIKNHTNLHHEFFKISSIDQMTLSLSKFETTKKYSPQQDCETCTYLSDIIHNETLADEHNILLLKISESIKFKLESPNLRHKIELFRIKGTDFFSVVAKFHLPCVRAYYTGTNLYMLPSCVSALMTGYNIDYKYFAGIRNPIEIIIKYVLRGFTIILNNKEKNEIMKYLTGVLNSTDQIQNDKFILFIKHIFPKIFPYMFGMESINIANSISNINNPINVIKELNQLNDYYTQNNSCYGLLNMNKFKTINDDGNICPLKKWVIDAFLDTI